LITLGRGDNAQPIRITSVRIRSRPCRARIVQSLAGRLTHVVTADSTDIEAMRQLGAQEFSRAVVGIGTDLEASREHGKILRRIGAHDVVLPEYDMGERVAHLVTGRMLDYIEFEDNFAIVKTTAPAWAVGKPLGESGIRSKYGVTVVCVKRRGQDFTYATAETLIMPGDTLIVAGPTEKVEKFADMT
jgi:trk system potassium uptake protein TrkA